MSLDNPINDTGFFSLLLDALPNRVFWKDTNLVYKGCNKVFANDMGFESPSELVGKDDYATNMTEEEANICRAVDFEVLKSGESIIGSEEVIQSGDEKSWITVTKVPLKNNSGEIVGLLGTYSDITEEKKAQIEIENSLQREKSMNEMKTNFISTVSHEYRNPLSNLQLSLDTLINYLDEMSVLERDQLFLGMQDQISRMTELLEDVIFIGQDENELLDRKYEAIQLEQFCQNLIAEMADFDAQRIEFAFTGSSKPIICVSSHLTLILNNLIGNALKYSSSEVAFSVNKDDENFEVIITDQGIGIPKEDQDEIFKTFYRSKNVGSIKGSGLGLFIVQKSLATLNSKLCVNSEQNKGTTVSFKMPCDYKRQ
ncbi:MAG: PAS domain-containing sensor histidine kinase [Acidiferrobacterales bacterium]|nr:PAS domain-containing sensor histidine kinase [Acidiferrobacterales bacterium]